MDSKVPNEIMNAAPAERVAYFKRKSVPHAHQTEVFEPLWNWMNGEVNNLLVFVIGLSGIGKTRLCRRLLRRFYKQRAELLNEQRGSIPAILSTQNERSERYSWREFYQTGLGAADEPLIQYKILPRVLNKKYIPTGRPTVDRWGNAYAEALTNLSLIHI